MSSFNKPEKNSNYIEREFESVHFSDREQFVRSAFEKDVEEGFNLLFRQYHTVLCNHALRYVYSKDVAQDIVSEIFLNFWKNQDFFSVTTSFRTYLFKAVRNRCYNYLKREYERMIPYTEYHDNITIDLHTADRILQFDELQHKIESIISQLPPQCQKVFLMNKMDGKKYSEIAEELGLSIKTVEMHISRALKTLRIYLKEDLIWGLFLILINM